MKIYTVFYIMKPIIEFLRLEDGTQPTLQLIRQLMEASKTSPNAKQLLKLVLRGLEFVEKYGLPDIFHKYFTTQREDGRPYTIMIAKKLNHHPPLMEFRINWQQEDAGAFRAIFFEYPYNDQQILVFAHAVIKQQTTSDEFENAIAATEALMPDFYANPAKYINLQGAENYE